MKDRHDTDKGKIAAAFGLFFILLILCGMIWAGVSHRIHNNPVPAKPDWETIIKKEQP